MQRGSLFLKLITLTDCFRYSFLQSSLRALHLTLYISWLDFNFDDLPRSLVAFAVPILSNR